MSDTPTMKIDNVELGKVRPSKTNPRKDFKEAEMQELTDSVRLKGVLQPLLVRPSWCIGLDQEAINKINGQTPAAEFYEIVAGERRYRAAERAELPSLPLIVRQLSDQETLEIQLIENLQREDLDPFDEAEGYNRLLALRDGHGKSIHTVETISLRVGKPRRRIYFRLRLLLVPENVRQMVREGNLPIDTAELIGSIPAPELREAAAEQILYPQYEEGPLNRRKARELIADNYMRSLASAPFDQADENLVPVMIEDATGERNGGGGCGNCPKRTGNMEAIIGKTKRPDVCTNPRCYMMKCDAQFSRLQTEAVKEGKRLISEAEAKEIFDDEDGSIRFDSPFVKLSDKPDAHECPGTEIGAKLPTWGKLLEAVESKPPLYVARDPRGRIVELVDRKLAIEAVKLASKQGGGSSIFEGAGRIGGNQQNQSSAVVARTNAEDRKKKEAAKRTLEVTLASLQALYEAANTERPDGFLDLMIGLSILHAGHDGQWLVCKWLKLEPKADKDNRNAKDFAGAIERFAKDLPGESKPGLVLCLLLSQRAKFNGAAKDAEFKKFAGLFKIDIGEIERAARAESKQKIEAKKAEENKPPSIADYEASYSADRISDGKIKGIVVLDGVEYVNTGGMSFKQKHEFNLCELIPAEKWTEKKTTHAERFLKKLPGEEYAGDTARSDPNGGYYGIQVKFRGKNYVLGKERTVKITDKRPKEKASKPAVHKFEKITDNKYRCKNCGAFAVKHEGKMLLAKEFRGKPCSRTEKENVHRSTSNAQRRNRNKKKVKAKKKAKAKRR